MISHKYKAIYIHLPKCAGTSIEKAFGHFKGHHGRGGQDHRSIREIKPLEISELKYLNQENLKIILKRVQYHIRKKPHVNSNNYLTVDKKQYQTYLKFTIVRNPYDRAYSWYKAILKDEINRKIYRLNKHISFEEFLKRYLGKKRLMKPYVFFLKDFEGNIPCDFIGRFENLEEDFNRICKLLNVDLCLPHKNKGGNHKHYRNFYTSESIKLIQDYYAEDLKYFNYSFI